MSRFDACHRLGSQTTIVTGAGSGIGKGCALRLAQEGALVICGDIAAEAAEATAHEIVAAGGQARGMVLDVTDEASVAALIAAVLQDGGRIDGLLNCAGIVRGGAAGDLTRQDWDNVLAVNLTGTWLMCRAVLPGMQAQGGGSIVNISSVGALVAPPSNAAYIASKAGVAMLTKSIALDYGPQNIRCNAICPGTVMTPRVVGHWVGRGDADPDAMEEGMARSRARYPLKRHGEPEEIAAFAAYLLSGESEFMTGAVVPIDGGMSSAAWLPGN